MKTEGSKTPEFKIPLETEILLLNSKLNMDKTQTHQIDEKGNTTYYDSDRINVGVMMERIWGTENYMIWCEMTAFKYRMRVGKKEGPTVEQELIKANWYERAARFYKEKLKTDPIPSPNPNDCKNPFK